MAGCAVGVGATYPSGGVLCLFACRFRCRTVRFRPIRIPRLQVPPTRFLRGRHADRRGSGRVEVRLAALDIDGLDATAPGFGRAVFEAPHFYLCFGAVQIYGRSRQDGVLCVFLRLAGAGPEHREEQERSRPDARRRGELSRLRLHARIFHATRLRLFPIHSEYPNETPTLTPVR